MRKLIFILLSLCSICINVTGQDTPRKKIGVVLSGGAAKGFAHVGVLKVLENVGIPIDIIVGSSMGAVIGGHYSLGYNAHMLDSMIQLQDWNYLLRDNVYRYNLHPSIKDNLNGYIISLPYKVDIKNRKGKIKLPTGVYTGQNLYSLFMNNSIGYQNDMDFNNLPIPFGCVAADLRTGEEVVLRKGSLAKAMRASMAIPGMFTPIEIDSMLLVDGGIINKYPVDLARKMGADIVIGVIMPPNEESIYKNRGYLSEIIESMWNFIGKSKYLENMKNTDILITPDIHPYSSSDFKRQAIDSVISRGEKAAMEKWDDLMALKESLYITDSLTDKRTNINPFFNLDTLLINKLSIEGLSRQNEEQRILKWIPVKDNKVTRKQLDEMTARLYGSGLFSQVYFQLEGVQPFDLVFRVQEKDFSTLNVSVNFDTENMAALLLNTTIQFKSALNSTIDLTSRISRNPYLILAYSVNNGSSYRGVIDYKISQSNLSIYNKGVLSNNLRITRNTFNIILSEFYFGNIKLRLGAGLDHLHSFNELSSNLELDNRRIETNQLYINYLFDGIYDNLNESYFPSSGQYFSFKYMIHTDNFYKMENDPPLSILKMNFYKPVNIAENIYLTPKITARYIMNDSLPLIYRNFVGGRFDSYYLPQQISIQDSSGMEVLENMVLAAETTVHYNFKTNNYLYCNLNYTINNNKLYNLFKGKSFLGINLGYSYLTMAGPIRAELGYSGLSRKFHPYMSFGYNF